MPTRYTAPRHRSSRARQSGSPTGRRSRGADISAPKFDPPPGSAATLARLVEARPRPLPRPRRETVKQSGRETRLPCTAASAMRCGVTGRHTIPLGDAFWGREVSLAPVPGPHLIAAGTVIVEVLVVWSPALPRRFPPEAAWCPCGFPSRQKKRLIL